MGERTCSDTLLDPRGTVEVSLIHQLVSLQVYSRQLSLVSSIRSNLLNLTGVEIVSDEVVIAIADGVDQPSVEK